MKWWILIHLAGPYVYDTENRAHVGIEVIIGFYPYMKLGIKLLRNLYNNGSLQYDVLLQISERYPDFSEYFEHILLDNSTR